MVGPDGGVVKPNVPHSPLHGMTIDVPKGAICRTWTLRSGDEADPDWGVFHGRQPWPVGQPKTFKAHINVESCNSIKSIKYITKYVNKGSDMAVFGVEGGSEGAGDY